MQIFLRVFIVFTLFISVSIGQDSPLKPQNFIPPKPVGNQNQNLTDLQGNNFYLNLKQEDIEATIKRDKEVKEAFDGFSQKEINYKPVIRPIASMDTISLHPYFTFTMLLPQGSVISHIDSSSPMAVLKHDQNALMIRPNADFKIANITLFYKLNDVNHVLNVLATRYEKNNDEKLNVLYSYRDIEKLEPLDVLFAYIKQNNDYPKDKYSYITIDDVSYRIVEDEKYGTLMIRGKKYRVDNNTVFN